MATNLKKTTTKTTKTTKNTSRKTPTKKDLTLLDTNFTYINFAEKVKEGGRFVM